MQARRAVFRIGRGKLLPGHHQITSRRTLALGGARSAFAEVGVGRALSTLASIVASCSATDRLPSSLTTAQGRVANHASCKARLLTSKPPVSYRPAHSRNSTWA